jgi:Arc/MetJ family transcription regulator
MIPYMTPAPKTLSGKTTRRNIMIEDSMWQRAIRAAKTEDRTVSSVVRLALKEFLDKRGR